MLRMRSIELGPASAHVAGGIESESQAGRDCEVNATGAAGVRAEAIEGVAKN